MSGELAGKVAFITGGGRGIGRGVAETFAEQGASVAVMARSADQLAETVSLVEAKGARGLAVSGDVTSMADVNAAVARTQQTLGPVDVLVSNAGITGPFAPVIEADPEEWWRTQEVHLRGAFLCSRAVMPGMMARGGGRIIIVASRAAERGGAGSHASAYGIAKASQLRLTEFLAAEGAEYGIRAFVLHPGLVDTQFTDDALGRDDARRWAAPFLQRLSTLRADPATGNPMSQVTALCAFLASGRGDSLSGRYLSVDYDYEEMARNADKIASEDLYTLRLRTLTEPAGPRPAPAANPARA